jgi:hypothetical protein
MRLLPIAAILSFLIASSVAQLPTLLDALKSSGAKQFAQVIENSPTLLAFFTSSQVKTVFAPVDTSDDETSSSRKKRDDPTALLDQQQQGEADQDKAKDLAGKSHIDKKGGAAVPMNTTRSSTTSTTSPGPTKRWVSPLHRREDNDTKPTSVLRLFSGLGNNISIIVADIQYDGGIIHIVDG